MKKKLVFFARNEKKKEVFSMGDFFKNTMTGLLQAIEIEKGNIEVKKVENLPTETYRVAETDNGEKRGAEKI
jgi:hypothetical protein